MTSRIVLNETSYHGAGATREIIDEAKIRGFKRAFICLDPDLTKSNVTTKVTKISRDAGFVYKIYSDIKPNPTIENIQTGVTAFRVSGADYTITIGGDSSMDISKAIGIIIANPKFEDVRSLEGVAPIKSPCVPIIAVPIAAGAAVGVIINYMITDAEKKRKFVCVDTYDIPVVAMVDPEMIASMPKRLTAATGIDALTHAIEGYTTRGTWEMINIFNLKAIEVIARSLRNAAEGKPESKEGMVLGQYLTGMDSSNCRLGIVHSVVYGLGALYDTPHGVVNTIILPTVMEYGALYTRAKFKDITTVMGVEGAEDTSQEGYHKAAVDAMKKLPQDVGVPADLKKIVKPEDADPLSQSTMDDACCPGNPEDPSLEDIKNLYLSLM